MDTQTMNQRNHLATEAVRRLARTINIGVDLGSPSEHGWAVDITDRHLGRIAEAGFSAVRVVVSSAAHRSSDSGEIDPAALDRVQRVVRTATEAGLAVVVANAIDPELMADPAAHRGRLLRSARALAGSIADHGSNVLLEPLSEPSQALDAVWNGVLADLIDTVRSVDSVRTLVAGPRGFNNARFLADLDIPADERNLVIAIHHYWPIRFTMQGETWLGPTELGDPTEWLGTTWTGSAAEQGELEQGFAAVAGWAAAHDRPLFVGEFGTTNNADMPSRVRWTRFNRELTERHGFAWGVWSFGPTFAVFDAEQDRWHPDLRGALFG